VESNQREAQAALRHRHEGRQSFGIGGLWENWKDPASGEWIRTFVVITTGANELVAQIHDRMPLIIAPADYERWLGDEPDPHDLMRPFPGELMRMWPISTRVNKPENDDPSILEPIKLSAALPVRNGPLVGPITDIAETTRTIRRGL
jgi:putative SOS response-associated peptidase YedK